LFKDATKEEKIIKLKLKAYNFFSTIGIPGIPMIVTTDNKAFKVIWTIFILISFGFGVYNVYEASNDYYSFDVITNIERLAPENFTFPAISVCTYSKYKRDRYENGSLINTGDELIYDDSTFRIRNFINSYKYSEKGVLFNITNKVDFFKFPEYTTTTKWYEIYKNNFYECFRFNGATDKNVELITTNTSVNLFVLDFNNSYIENTSDKEYYKYSISDSNFKVFIANNYLNSFEKVQPIVFEQSAKHDVKIEISSLESKLSKPYSQCKEESDNKPYKQMNCIETCIYKSIKENHNCTFNSLFSIKDSKVCRNFLFPSSEKSFGQLKDKYYGDCKNKCPIGCHSIQYSYTNFNTFKSTSNLTQFEFSIPDFSTLNINQIPKMNSFSFICNIGGALGLFMGISFLNIVEILEFLIDISSVFY
jgi:hypothetical protein